VFVEVIPVSALLYMLLIAIKKTHKKLEYNILVSTLRKLLVFLLNYTYYAPFCVMKKLGKGCFGISERIVSISIISYGKKRLDLRPTWVTTRPREQI
jgi:hypothetical protein